MSTEGYKRRKVLRPPPPTHGGEGGGPSSRISLPYICILFGCLFFAIVHLFPVCLLIDSCVWCSVHMYVNRSTSLGQKGLFVFKPPVSRGPVCSYTHRMPQLQPQENFLAYLISFVVLVTSVLWNSPLT